MTAARDFGRPRPRVSRFGLPPTAAPHRREIAYDSQEPRPFQLAVGSLRQAILSVNRRFWRDFELWHHPRGQRRGRAPAPGQGGGPRAGRHGDGPNLAHRTSSSRRVVGDSEFDVRKRPSRSPPYPCAGFRRTRCEFRVWGRSAAWPAPPSMDETRRPDASCNCRGFARMSTQRQRQPHGMS